MFQINNTVFRMFRQERKLFKLLKKALNEKGKVTILVPKLSQKEALEREAKRLGKEVIRLYNSYIIIDNKIFVTIAPTKSVLVFVNGSNERGKRSQEIYWV